MKFPNSGMFDNFSLILKIIKFVNLILKLTCHMKEIESSTEQKKNAHNNP